MWIGSTSKWPQPPEPPARGPSPQVDQRVQVQAIAQASAPAQVSAQASAQALAPAQVSAQASAPAQVAAQASAPAALDLAHPRVAIPVVAIPVVAQVAQLPARAFPLQHPPSKAGLPPTRQMFLPPPELVSQLRWA